jgi:predicted porin
MKKTLIAVAAAALSMGAMAQNVTLSGKFAVGYGKGISSATAKSQSNFHVTDGDVRFTASEDLGGGMKAATSMEVRVRGRGAAGVVDGRNATVGLSGGFGSITLGAVEAGNGIIGLGFAGAPVALATGYDGAILSGPANVDWAAYRSPALLPGLTAKLERFDSAGGPGNNRNLAGNVLGADYSAGAMSISVDYTDFNSDRTRVRASGSYNLGVAVLGVGYEDNRGGAAVGGPAGTQTAFGVTVPLGSVSAGLIFAKSEENNTQGWGVGMNYSLSKRTTFNVSYGDQTRGAPTSDGAQYRLRLLHTF